MALTELTNRFDNSSIQENIKSLKDHINEYFLLGETENGIINLKLDIVGDETLTADCDVTDHYTEENKSYQDQISIKPKIYTVNGEVGELVWYQKDSSSQVLGQVAQRLEGVVSFLPISSKSFSQFKNNAMKAMQWVDTASNALSKVSNLMSTAFNLGNGKNTRSVTNQEQAYEYLVSFRDNRTLLKIKTPWGILENYVITNLKFNQPKETKDKSYISISFKEIRLVTVNTVKFDASKYQGNALYENQPKTDNGTTSGEDVSLPTHKEVTTGTYKFEDIEGGVVWDACDMPDTDYSAMFSDEYGFSVYNRATKTFISSSDSEYGDVVAWGEEQCKLGIGSIK